MSIWAASGPARKVRQIKTASGARLAAIFSIMGSPRERIFLQYIKKSPGRGGDGRGPWWAYFLKANSDDKAPGRPDHSKKPKNRKPQTGKRKTENGKRKIVNLPLAVGQQAFTGQGQGHLRPLQPGLRRGGVVDQQEDPSRPLPQILQSLGGNEVVPGRGNRAGKLREAVALHHEDRAAGVKGQGGAIFVLLDLLHDHQVEGSGVLPEPYSRDLVAQGRHEGQPDAKGEQEQRKGQDAVASRGQTGSQGPAGIEARQGQGRDQVSHRAGHRGDEAEHARELPAIGSADLLQIGEEKQGGQPQEADDQQGPEGAAVPGGIQIALKAPADEQGQGWQGRQGVVFDAAGGQAKKDQDHRGPDDQNPAGAVGGFPGLPPEAPAGAGEQGCIGTQPDAQKEPETGKGEGIDVLRLAPSQEAQYLFINDLEFDEPRVGQLAGRKPGDHEKEKHGQAHRRPENGEQAGLAQLPGIEDDYQPREYQADEAFAEKSQPQGQEEEGAPLAGRLLLPAQQEIERGCQKKGDEMIGEDLQVQGKKADAAQEDQDPQPGRLPSQQAPADEVGDPDLRQGHPQEGQAGHPVGDPEKLIAQQGEPVEQVGFVPVREAVEGGGQPGARGQHLFGDEGVHGLGSDQG